MKLAMGCDPAAYRFYKKLLERMKEEGYDIVDMIDHHILKEDLIFGVRDLIKAKERSGLECDTAILSAKSLFNLLGYDTRNLRGSDINFLNW